MAYVNILLMKRIYANIGYKYKFLSVLSTTLFIFAI